MLTWPDDLSAGDLTVVTVAALVAGLARGFSGFGAALIFIPVASATIGPRLAVPLLLVIDAVTSLGMLPAALRRADRREVMVMALGAVVGAPAGTWLLTHAPAVALRWAIVATAFTLLLLLASGWRYRGRPHEVLTGLVGAMSGLFSGAAQMGGPPVVAYWLGGTATPDLVRANIVLFFQVSTVISIVNFVLGGLFVADLVPLALVTGPVYGAGLIVGSRMFGRASPALFRRASLGLIALASVIGLPLLDGLLR